MCAKPAARQPTITLSYKRASKCITTRLPVIAIDIGQGDMFWRDKSFEILLEAHDKGGHIVGEARPGAPVNAATRTVTLTPDRSVQVTLKMDDAFEGKFSVKALDPTTLKAYAAIDLLSRFDFAGYAEGRRAFTRDEWLDSVLR